MTTPDPLLDDVAAFAEEHQAAWLQADIRRDRLVAAIVAALTAGRSTTDVARAAGWDVSYVRRIGRRAGLPPGRGGPPPRKPRQPPAEETP